MRRQTFGVVTILLCLVGAGCSLPEVYPLVAGPTGGPSPYGAWYEQHWATNAVLLASSNPQHFVPAVAQETGSEEATATEASDDAQAKPHPCCNTPNCRHHDGSSAAESEAGEPETAVAPADGVDGGTEATPAAAPAAPDKSTGKVRY